MSKYVFDVNEGDSPDWDDEDFECDGRFAVESHARKLLAEAGSRQFARGSEALPATVVVYQEDGTIIMSAHGWPGGAVRILWDQERPTIPGFEAPAPQLPQLDARDHARGVISTLVERLGEATKGKS